MGWVMFENNPDNASVIRMKGGIPLYGSVQIQGSKNIALPIIAASILVNGKCTLSGCPDITDVDSMFRLIESAGAIVCKNENQIYVNAENINEYCMPSRYASVMRSSVILLGALLGRIGEASIDYPGGCVIGKRPIDLHIFALEKLGAEIDIVGNKIRAKAKKLTANTIHFPFSSVGATQNTILAAVYANGITKIENAAREPEVTALCDYLNKAGARVVLSDNFLNDGIIEIYGVEKNSLHDVEYSIPADRIVAGTYLFAVLATSGRVELQNAPIDNMNSVLHTVIEMGAQINKDINNSRIVIEVPDRNMINNLDFVETSIYPGFPTDMQSQLMAVACTSKGRLCIRENIFSNRFKIVDELKRMGAQISIKNDNEAEIDGVASLEGRNVIAKELRGGAALVSAGLAAEGITTVTDIEYIKRGYEDIVNDFARLGAQISYD